MAHPWAGDYHFSGESARAGCERVRAASIVSAGILKSEFKPKKDFGKGFYTTTLLAQAVKWARGGAVLRWNVPDTLMAGLQQLDFGKEPSVEWQNTVTQGRRGLLDVTPYPLHVDVVSGILLRNVEQAERNPLTATGDGQQTVWVTDAALRVLQTNKPFYMGGP